MNERTKGIISEYTTCKQCIIIYLRQLTRPERQMRPFAAQGPNALFQRKQGLVNLSSFHSRLPDVKSICMQEGRKPIIGKIYTLPIQNHKTSILKTGRTKSIK